jgi:type II secretory ATPase GspE/PulE/Tfp pilus assembly ATPase PilB-like protein
MGVEPYLINASLICVVSQRLVRKVCFYCREQHAIEKETAESLKLSPEMIKKQIFFRGKGCLRCFNTGYSARLGIAEILLLSGKIRELILERSQEHIIKKEARREGMKTLREEGIQAVLKGLTTLDEILRVTPPDE